MTKSAIAIRGPLVKSLIFAITTTLVLVFVSIELGGFRFYDTKSYKAEFTNASELLDGDSVMVNGVKVGSVTDISVHQNTRAMVGFKVRSSVKLPADTEAMVRYKNLTGDRYLEIRPGQNTTSWLVADSTIPASRTKPALDLDVLLGGLEPLFEGLDPGQINQLSAELVSVLQGEGGTVESILRRTASFTSTLAERDEVIGRTIDNLNSVLGSLDTHSKDLNETVSGLDEVATGLSKDRERLGKSFGDVDTLVSSLDGLLTDLRGPFAATVSQLGRVTTQANKGSETINAVLRDLPGDYKRIGRLGTRGAGYNLYLCSVRVRLTGGDGKPIYTPWIGPDPSIERCKFGVAPLETPEDRAAEAKKGAGQ